MAVMERMGRYEKLRKLVVMGKNYLMAMES